jgi:hypothetical protein
LRLQKRGGNVRRKRARIGEHRLAGGEIAHPPECINDGGGPGVRPKGQSLCSRADRVRKVSWARAAERGMSIARIIEARGAA